jgi:lipopolysaccharide/colanic/teichoic acid biosynthesis glycosyltransferase
VTRAAKREEDRYADVERAAERLARPALRSALALKRVLDALLALAMLVAVMPLLLAVAALLLYAGDGWLDRRQRLGRHGRAIVLSRFRALPGGAVGRAFERAGARELPLLFAVLRGTLSFVGPRVLPLGTAAVDIGPRLLMAPGLIGPAQRAPASAEDAGRLDDAYVERWSLWVDARLLAGGRPQLVHHSVSKSSS